MKIFIHAGTEKTGSSHLQTLCVNGREQLKAQGIWFPKGIPRHEMRMRDGLVSAGNGFTIAEFCRTERMDCAESELEKKLNEAHRNGCSAICLSSELLVPYCTARPVWQSLLEACLRIGFSSISILVILRDPVDQLISLYKHRARSGRAGRLAEWITDGYHLPEDLSRLRQGAEMKDVALVARRYTRAAGGLERIFFTDWLGISAPSADLHGEVNPSLSLSELELIRCVNNRRPELVSFLFERLSALPRLEKGRSSEHEAYAIAMARAVAWKYREEWLLWNQILPAGEGLALPDAEPAAVEPPTNFAFSDRQIDELASFLSESTSRRFLLRLLLRGRIRPMLSAVKRLLCRF